MVNKWLKCQNDYIDNQFYLDVNEFSIILMKLIKWTIVCSNLTKIQIWRAKHNSGKSSVGAKMQFCNQMTIGW